MNTILELREKRAKAWEGAKAFLDSKRGNDGLLSGEDTQTYERMEADVMNLGKEIERLERQASIDAELSRPTASPLTNHPGSNMAGEMKKGKASDAYRDAFWKAMRNKNSYDVHNALQIGTDSEGGYLVPDEFERTLIESLEEENVFRSIAKVITTSSGDRKIPVVATKGTAFWVAIADNCGSGSISKSCHITLEIGKVEVLIAAVGHGEGHTIAVIGVMDRLGTGGLKGYFPAQVGVLRGDAIDTFFRAQAAGVVFEA